MPFFNANIGGTGSMLNRDIIEELGVLEPSREGLERALCILGAEVGALAEETVRATAESSEEGVLLSDGEETTLNHRECRVRLALCQYGALKRRGAHERSQN